MYHLNIIGSAAENLYEAEIDRLHFFFFNVARV